MFVIGYSAGAYLVSLLSTDERYVAAHKLSLRDIRGVVPVSGFYWVERTGVAPDRDKSVWGTDPKVWVVLGDLPPAYLAFDEGDTWQDALRGYVEEMQQWVNAVRAGESLEDVIPVNVSATREHADILATRLQFIRERLVSVDAASLESDA